MPSPKTNNSLFSCSLSARYFLRLHSTWTVNSLAHLYGSRPVKKDMYPANNALVSLLTHGEGMHNYHHCFPYDYRGCDAGFIKYLWPLNLSTLFIDVMYALGMAHDRKKRYGINNIYLCFCIDRAFLHPPPCAV